MIRKNNECMDCSVYYYDYLYDGRDQIPESALEHLSVCKNCKAEMIFLKCELEKPVTPEQQAQNAAQVTNLELHFAYKGRPVGCNEAKQFLALMASSFVINVPTPITVHIVNCPSCTSDLKALYNLELPEDNLFKVGQIIADDNILSQGESVIRERLCTGLGDIEYRQSMIDDLVMVAMRPASSMKTLYRFKSNDSQRIGKLIENPAYDDRNIEVTLLNESEISELKSSAAKKPSANINFAKYLKPIAAAAVLMITFLLFRSPTAIADYDQIYKALEKIKNVYLRSTDAISGQVTQETWISRDLNVKYIKSGNRKVLWDIDNKLLLTSEPGNDIKKERLSSDSIRAVSASMQVPWSLLPFKSISKLPEGATWELIKQPDGIEIYEIIWTEQLIPKGEIITKWRGFVDSKTFLPKLIEWYNKKQADPEFVLKKAIEVSYPDTDQVREIIDELK